MKPERWSGLLLPRSVVCILVRVKFQTRMGPTLKYSIRLACREAAFILLNECWLPLWKLTLCRDTHYTIHRPKSVKPSVFRLTINLPQQLRIRLSDPPQKEKFRIIFAIFNSWHGRIPSGPGPPLWGDTLKHTTFGETPLDERSASRTNLYMTTHNTQKRQISKPPAVFEPATPASEQPLWPALLLNKKLNM
jgi:hypothetical protein